MKKYLVGLIMTIFVLSPFLFAQVQGKARLRGIVYDDDTGEPLAGVTVKLYNDTVAAFYLPAPVTDKEGKWAAYYIRTGRWDLEFEKVGYAPQKLSYNVTLAPGQLEEPVTIRLRKVKDLIVKENVIEKVNKGNQLFAEKKYAEARAVYEAILAENPDVYVLNKNIGNCYFALEDYDRAIESYMKVYEKQPDQPDILIAIANAYNNSGRKDQAAEWYKKIKFEDIQDIDTAYNAGVSFYNSGDPTEALKYFKKAVDIDKGFADGYFQLGLCSVATNNVDEALAALTKFLELAPDSPQAPTAKSILEALTKK